MFGYRFGLIKCVRLPASDWYEYALTEKLLRISLGRLMAAVNGSSIDGRANSSWHELHADETDAPGRNGEAQ